MKPLLVHGTWLLLCVCVPQAWQLDAAACAQEGRGITVSASGVVEAMPDSVELTAAVEGNAELAGDAVEKFRGSKRRVIESLNRLKLAGMSIAGAGPAVNSGTPVNPGAIFEAGQIDPTKVATKVAVQERLIVTLSGINAMSADDLLKSITRVVDAVKDAGAIVTPDARTLLEIQMGNSHPGSLARFKLGDREPLRQRAYDAAVQQARARAERLAKSAGVELGEIISIRETASLYDDSRDYFQPFTGASNDHGSGELRSIGVTVQLSVQFSIAGKK